MQEKQLTRDNIAYQIKGLEMTLRYLRDALMYTFMDIPIKYFFGLNGNLPLQREDRMLYLNHTLSNIDLMFFKDAKTHIFNTNDKDLAEKYCQIDLLVWQLTILSSRFKRRDKIVQHIGGIVSELL